MSAAQLLATIATTPSLPGAACVADREVFDAVLERGSSRLYPVAIRICAQCPALAPCRAWVNSMPIDERPHGVTAGQVRNGRWAR